MGLSRTKDRWQNPSNDSREARMAEPKPSSVQRRVTDLKGLIPKDISNVTAAFQTTVKWYFDLIRNLLIAGSLKFLAVKTGSQILGYLAELSIFLVWAYFFTYLVSWPGWPLQAWSRRPEFRLLSFVVGLLLCAFLYFGTSIVFGRVINELANGQSRQLDDRGRPSYRRRSNLEYHWGRSANAHGGEFGGYPVGFSGRIQ
jgi:hypothetical protein